MKRKKIEGEKIKLQLLTKDDLQLWLENPIKLSEILNLKIDSDALDDHLRDVFMNKISNMNENPECDHWYSYFAILFDDTIIGTIGSKGKPDSSLSIEIGYGISEKYFKHGFTTEALKLLSDFFFKEYDLKKIIARTDQLNIASQKVLIKNGFIKCMEGDLQKWELSAKDRFVNFK